MSTTPCFVWSGQESEAVEFDDGTSIAWGKPLEKIFHKWPCWNFSNIVIIDHKGPRVGCNPSVNVIIPPPFYVQDVEGIGDDRQFLKLSLWPVLQRLYGCQDVADFRSHIPSSLVPSGLKVPLHEKEFEAEVELDVVGEGTCEPNGSASQLSPPCAWKYNSIFVFWTCVEELGEERGEDEGSTIAG
jgi:hypothetical protein